MYVTAVPNRGAKPTILRRESYREEGKVKSRTLANLTRLPEHAIEAVRRALDGEALVSAQEAFEVESSEQHGHVEAVLTAMRKLGFEALLSSRPCRERDIALAMIAARIIEPGSKLETTRAWKTTSLPTELGVADAEEDDLYDAMDWLLARQPDIEKKLAARHLKPGGLVLYDLTSTWVEGKACPLASSGYSRDGKRGKLQINFGLLTDDEGRPITTTVYAGNTADPSTVQEQVAKLKAEYKLDHVIFVGDRGMVTETQIDRFLVQGGVEWITAVRSGGIQKLKSEGSLQLGLFDDRNLFEFASPSYPGERLVACRNPDLAEHRRKKRDSLIEATRADIEKIQLMIARGSLVDKAEIGLRVGRIIDKHNVAKHFKIEIKDRELHYRVRTDRVEREASIDGIYVIRTSVPADVVSADDAVRHYKRLTRVERAFRSLKTLSLHVRPIYHHTESRVRAHIFLCMLAYYVEWHMRRAWAPLLFTDEVDRSVTRDPVAAATPSRAARRKAATKKAADGSVLHSFSTLITHLSAIVRNHCRRKGATNAEPRFEMTTRPDPTHRRAIKLLESCSQ
ncbi:MAG: IS1634 family transposase [Deltaproteobacteria bacterium]|nr:IS1634 family transposase [Deltaproteobacteria bacterium]